MLEHLPLPDAIATATARRLFPLVEPAEPYLRRCISGALQHHLRDRVRLVPEAPPPQ